MDLYFFANTKDKSKEYKLLNLNTDIRDFDFIPLREYADVEGTDKRNNANIAKNSILSTGYGMYIEPNTNNIKYQIMSRLSNYSPEKIGNILNKINQDSFDIFLKLEAFLFVFKTHINRVDVKLRYKNNSLEQYINIVKSRIDESKLSSKNKSNKAGITQELTTLFTNSSIEQTEGLFLTIGLSDYIENRASSKKPDLYTKYTSIKTYLLENRDNVKSYIQGRAEKIGKLIPSLNKNEDIYNVLLKQSIVNIDIFSGKIDVFTQEEKRIKNEYDFSVLVDEVQPIIESHSNRLVGSYNKLVDGDIKTLFYLYYSISNNLKNPIHHSEEFIKQMEDKSILQTNRIGDVEFGTTVKGYYKINEGSSFLDYTYQIYPLQTRVENNPINQFNIEKQLYLYQQTREFMEYKKRFENEYASRRGYVYGSREQYIEQKSTENINSKKKQIVDNLNSIRKQILAQFEKASKKPARIFVVGIQIDVIIPDKAEDVDTRPYEGNTSRSFRNERAVCSRSENKFRSMLDFLSSIQTNRNLQENKENSIQDIFENKVKNNLNMKSIREKLREDGKLLSEDVKTFLGS
jgi:hypothetical protein